MELRQISRSLSRAFSRHSRNLGWGGSETVTLNGETRPIGDLVRGIDMFASLKERQIGKLADLLISRRDAAGTLLIKEGDKGLGMFLVTSGKMEVFQERQGQRIPLATVEPGACVGEMSLIDEQPRSASVRVTEDSECLLLTRDRFNQLAKQDIEILWNLVPFLVDRLRKSDAEVALLAEGKGKDEGSRVEETTVERMDSSKGDSGDDLEPAASPDDSELESTTDNGSEQTGLLDASLRFAASTIILGSSALLAGTQANLRFLTGKDTLRDSLDKGESLLSGLSSRFEEELEPKARDVFESYENLLETLSSLMDD